MFTVLVSISNISTRVGANIAASFAAAFLLGGCGILICPTEDGRPYTLEARIVSATGQPIEGASSRFTDHGRTLFNEAMHSNALGIVHFEAYTDGYDYCQAVPHFESLAPLTLWVIHPGYDTTKITFSKADLQALQFRNGLYILPDVVLEAR